MDIVSKSIRKQVETGEYFQDAFLWYARKYLHPHTQRFYLTMLCILVAATVILTGGAFTTLFPLTRDITFVAKMDDTFGMVTDIHRLSGNETESGNRILARFLLSAYLTQRENYQHDLQKKQITYVDHNSSRPVLAQFLESIDENNPTSPVRLYQSHLSRTIAITNVNFIGDDDLPERATIRFIATISDKSDNIVQQNSYLASIVFTIPSIFDIINGREKMNFQVKSYHITQLGS